MKIVIAGREVEVNDEVITKALEEKTDVKVDAEFVIRSKEEDETYSNNLRAEAKAAGVEIAVKEARKNLGLEFTGKNIENLVDAVKAKTLEEAKIEPEEKVKNLMKDIETLKGSITSIQSEKETIENQFKGFKTESLVNNTIASLIPENTTLPKDDMLLLMKNKMKFDIDENSRVIVKDASGEVMKNATTLNPLEPKEVIQNFFNSNPVYIKGAGGGGGGDDTPGGGGKRTIEEHLADAKKAGKDTNSNEFLTELEGLIKQGLVE